MDPEAEALVDRALRDLLRGRTALVVAHRLSTVLGANRIAVVDQGRVVEEGTHAELLAIGPERGRYARLVALSRLTAPAMAS